MKPYKYLAPALIAVLPFWTGCGQSSAPGSATPAPLPPGSPIEQAQALIDTGDFQSAALAMADAERKEPANLERMTATAMVFLNWGYALEQKQDYDVARTKFMSAMKKIGERSNKGKMTEDGFRVAVRTHLALNGLRAAASFGERAVTRFPDSEEMALLHGWALTRAGRYTDGIALAKSALEKHPESYRLYWRQGYLLRCLGEYGKALESYEKAVKLAGEPGDEELKREHVTAQWLQSETMDEPKFWAHYNDAQDHGCAGRTDREAAESSKALAVLTALDKSGQGGAIEGEDWYRGRLHLGVSNGLELMGDYDGAYEQAKLALESTKRSSSSSGYGITYAMYTAALRAKNGAMRFAPGDPKGDALRQECIERLRETITYGKQQRAGHVVQHAQALLAEVLRTARGLDDPELQQLRRYFKKIGLAEGGPKGDCALSQIIATEARLCFEEGDFERAAELYEWTGNTYNSYSHLDTIRTRFQDHVNLVRCYHKLGDPEKVVKYGESAMTLADEVRKRLSDDYSKRNFLGASMQTATATTAAAYIDIKRRSKAFNLSERYKGRALMELLRGKALIPDTNTSQEVPSPNPAPAPAEPGVTVAAVTGGESLGSMMRDLQVEETAVKRLAQDTQVSGKVIASVGESYALELDELKPMAKDFTLVSYLFDNERGVALVLNEDDLAGVILPELTQEKLWKLMLQLRAEQGGAHAAARDLDIEVDAGAAAPAAGGTAAAEALYDMLISPILPHLKKPLVYLSTDGVLNYLPFDLLQKNGRYLMEDYALAHTPSATFLKWLLDKPKAGRETILAVGNPNLQNPAFRLVHAGAEAQAVRALFTSGDAWLEDAATEAAVYAHAPSADILHFACHGEPNPDNPMLSALRLAPDDGNDGYLHAGEVFDLDLKPSLVVLSACNSGAGNVSSGNELMGLTRSFFYAGAQSIVASLWFVDDRSTSELMQAFYRNLGAMNTAEALRQAKLEIKAKYPDPIHWAPFVLQGDFR